MEVFQEEQIKEQKREGARKREARQRLDAGDWYSRKWSVLQVRLVIMGLVVEKEGQKNLLHKQKAANKQ